MGKRSREESSAATKHKSKRTKTTQDDPEDATSDKFVKQKKTSKHDQSLDKDAVTPEQPDLEASAKPNVEDGEQQQNEAAPKKSRFIVFIGNLPYDATTEAIEKHFSKIKPDSVRHITQKPESGKNQRGPPKSKGFAFLEFTNFDRMKTCLKLYHHTKFDDTTGGTRKINVELTAGGGGTGEARSKKLKAKNAKLFGERMQRRNADEDAKAKKTTAAGSTVKVSGHKATAVHPSRRPRVKGS